MASTLRLSATLFALIGHSASARLPTPVTTRTGVSFALPGATRNSNVDDQAARDRETTRPSQPCVAAAQSLQTSLRAATTDIDRLAAADRQFGADVAQSQSLHEARNRSLPTTNPRLNAIATPLSRDNDHGSFKLPGTTREANLDALMCAINSLNRGQIQVRHQTVGGKP